MQIIQVIQIMQSWSLPFPPFISKIRKEHNYAWSHSRDDDLENAIDGIMEVLIHQANMMPKPLVK